MLTSGVLEGRYDVYMHADQADGLTRDTRVMLQGLEIGRVREVTPQLDTASNQLSFVATLSIRERFADGTRLSLPRATRALITQPSLVGAIVVELQMPPSAGPGITLEPGDTIRSERVATMIDAFGKIAAELSEDVAATLVETRSLLTETTLALGETRTVIAATTPKVTRVLDRLAESLDRADHMLATIEPQIGPLADSVMGTLGSTRALLSDFQELVNTTSDMATENRTVIAEIMQSLERSADILAHFADQISRRPLRFFTGVTPPDTSDGRP